MTRFVADAPQWHMEGMVSASEELHTIIDCEGDEPFIPEATTDELRILCYKYVNFINADMLRSRLLWSFWAVAQALYARRGEYHCDWLERPFGRDLAEEFSSNEKRETEMRSVVNLVESGRSLVENAGMDSITGDCWGDKRIKELLSIGEVIVMGNNASATAVFDAIENVMTLILDSVEEEIKDMGSGMTWQHGHVIRVLKDIEAFVVTPKDIKQRIQLRVDIVNWAFLVFWGGKAKEEVTSRFDTLATVIKRCDSVTFEDAAAFKEFVLDPSSGGVNGESVNWVFPHAKTALDEILDFVMQLRQQRLGESKKRKCLTNGEEDATALVVGGGSSGVVESPEKKKKVKN